MKNPLDNIAILSYNSIKHSAILRLYAEIQLAILLGMVVHFMKSMLKGVYNDVQTKNL